MAAERLEALLLAVAALVGTDYMTVRSVAAVVLVCGLCGLVGAQVVGSRMAFFSDTMAHAAFAGVALGYLSLIALGVGRHSPAGDRIVTLVMVLFGSAVGAGIVAVRDRTGLTNDTVIGVFFAAVIGFAAMLFRALQEYRGFNPEQFLFGSLLFVFEEDLLYLAGLGVVVLLLLGWRYNRLVLGSLNPSLARTRGVGLAVNNYLFIVLLALVVNLSIKAVGALLVNALLVVPAATAGVLAKNLRQMFWLTVAASLTAGLVGYGVSSGVTFGTANGSPVRFGPSGTVVVAAVGLFFLAMLVRTFLARFGFLFRPPHRHFPGDTCAADHGSPQCH